MNSVCVCVCEHGKVYACVIIHRCKNTYAQSQRGPDPVTPCRGIPCTPPSNTPLVRTRATVTHLRPNDLGDLKVKNAVCHNNFK